MTSLILIAGSMAAGKSTLAAEVAGRLRADGRQVALTALDDIAAMALPTLPSWQQAEQIHAHVVGLWARAGLDHVVDEGASTEAEVDQILGQLPPGTSVLHVVIATTYERALARAQADPTRGLSKDPVFLRAQYDEFARQLPRLQRDVYLEVTDQTPGELAREVIDALGTRGPSSPGLSDPGRGAAAG